MTRSSGFLTDIFGSSSALVLMHLCFGNGVVIVDFSRGRKGDWDSAVENVGSEGVS